MLRRKTNNIKQQKVLFVIPRVKSMFGSEEGVPPHPHVGIAYLISILKKNKYSVEVFDEGIEKSDQKLDDLINSFEPAVIGITGFSYAYGYLEEAINKIKKYCSVPIIVGGPHIAATDSEIMITTAADFAFKGEAEEAFLSFLSEFKKKNPDFNKVPGLIWKNKGKIIQNKPPGFIKFLDNLPFPDYEAFSLNKYPCFQGKSLPIITSRGCPYGCNYCSVRLSMGYVFRPRSPKNVVAELEYWNKKGFVSFDINDDCFTLDLKRAEEICELIIKKKLKIQFQLYNGIRVDRVTPKLLQKLKSAGCTFIAYGCESGNQEILNTIKKNITLEQVREAVTWTNNVGIKNAVNFIIGHKNETYNQARDSLEFAKNLPTNFVNFYNLVPYPGTEVYDWAIRNTNFLVNKKTFLKEISYRDNIPIFETKQFSKSQKEKVMKEGFNLYEYKIMQFRLGKPLGLIMYSITRINFISKATRWLFYKNKYIMKLYKLLSAKSQK